MEPVGLNDEIIIDYSVHDAIKAGFNGIIFIIHKDIEDDFKERMGSRVEEFCNKKGVEMRCCFQSLNDLLKGGIIPEGRIKPWGTGQAVLAAKNLINESFAVINADYYGKETFVKIHDWLEEEHDENAYSMADFILKNTLSDNGGVTRGGGKFRMDIVI